MIPPRHNRCDAGLWLVVVALVPTFGLSCTDVNSSSTAESVPTIGLTLSGDHPSACIRVGGAEQVVEFGVGATQNPDRGNIEIDVVDDDRVITVFGVYPPTTSQRFRTRLSAGNYSLDLRSDSNVITDEIRVELEISGATIC